MRFGKANILTENFDSKQLHAVNLTTHSQPTSPTKFPTPPNVPTDRLT